MNIAAHAATPEVTRQFLRETTHSWLPYPLPYETDMAEVRRVSGLGMDTVGLCYAAPYNGGNMDFSRLDEAISIVDAAGQRAVLHLTPRFTADEGVRDTLSDGTVLANIYNQSPNYSIADIFHPAQRAKLVDWIGRTARRYGTDPRVAGFVVGWGYMGETGFYVGDFVADSSQMGALSAGYSSWARRAFNTWRTRHDLPPVQDLPHPSTTRQSDEYISFMRFRSEYVRDVLQKELVDAVQSQTSRPVGLFAYQAAWPGLYARNWTNAPNADFYRTAGSASSFDMTRTLVDSGIGWEDASLHDGTWDFTTACLKRDMARQMARGGMHHAMLVRVYDTEPQWEPNVMSAVASFLSSSGHLKELPRPNPSVALFHPTWSAAVLPARDEEHPFLPHEGQAMCLTKNIGLIESFGLDYRLISEADLLQDALEPYSHIILPMSGQLERVLGQEKAQALLSDPRVIPIPQKDRPYTRAEMREILKRHGANIRLDFQQDQILAGRHGQVLYNWSNTPQTVAVPEQADPIHLSPHEFQVLPFD